MSASALRFVSARQWHWMSSAFCLVGMLLFAVTGITLNHAASIESKPVVTSLELTLSPALLQAVEQRAAGAQGPLPLALRQWLLREHHISTPDSAAEWDEREVYLALPRPGGDAWLSVDLDAGQLLYERTERGWISYLNDLHKGRNTGPAWQWFLDAFAVLCLLFSLTGLWLLQQYARQRPATWPLTALGVALPLLIVLLTIH